MRVLLGVTGGIAAYKVALVVRRLMEDGHSVRVIPTEASLNFVGRATWEALTGEPAPSGTFENVPSVEHITLGPTGRYRARRARDRRLPGVDGRRQARATCWATRCLATKAPVVVAPAMHTEMWHHPATEANVATLRARGVHVIEPAVGRLTGADSGPGRLPGARGPRRGAVRGGARLTSSIPAHRRRWTSAVGRPPRRLDSDFRGRHAGSRSTRCAFSAIAPLATKDSPWPRPLASAAPPSPWWPRT